MEFVQEKPPPTLEVLRVGDIDVSDGFLSIPLRVHVHGSADPEGDIVLVLNVQNAGDLAGKLQARIPAALRQLKGK